MSRALTVALAVVASWAFTHAHAASPAGTEAPGRVTALHSDATHLWAATTTGLWRIDPRASTGERYGTPDGLPSEAVYAIAESSGGQLWIATDRGPARRTAGRFEPVVDGLFSTDTTCVLPTAHGSFAGTARGIWRLDDGGATWELVYDSHDFARDRVVACAPGPDGSAWFAKETALTRVRPDGRYEILNRDPLNPDRAVHLDSTRVSSLGFDGHGALWLATDLGPRALDAAGAALPVPPLPWDGARRPARPWGLFVDGDDAVWVSFGAERGAGDRGVLRLAPGGAWTAVDFAPEARPDAVLCLARGPAGALWAGTSRGLYRLEDGRFVPWAPRAPAPVATPGS